MGSHGTQAVDLLDGCPGESGSMSVRKQHEVEGVEGSTGTKLRFRDRIRVRRLLCL